MVRTLAVLMAAAKRAVRFPRGDHATLADCLLQQVQDGGPIIVFDEGELYAYEPETGLWVPLSKNYLSRVIMGWSGARYGTGENKKRLRVSQPLCDSTIELAKRQADSPGFFVGAPRGLAFRDVFFRVDLEHRTLDQVQHTPDNRARFGLPFDLSEDKPGRFLRMLNTAFEEEADVADKILFLQEVIGGFLLGVAPWAGKAVMLYGGRGTGKSTFLRIVRALFPDNAVCSVAPARFDDDYHGARLAGKRLNVVFETPGEQILRESGFKAIVHGEEITRRRIRQEPVTFTPEAGHLFACNDLPPAPRCGDAYWDRWTIIGFHRTFRDTPVEEKNLAETIIKRELPQIASWATVGATRLLEQDGRYTEPESTKVLKRRWMREADTVALFFEECTSPVRDTVASRWPTKTQVYSLYSEWAKANGFKPCGGKEFRKRAEGIDVEVRPSNGVRYGCRLTPKRALRGGSTMKLAGNWK